MSRFRVLFLGTPEFAKQTLESILSDDHFEVVGVVTQPDRPAGRKMQLTPSPVKQLAIDKRLPVWTPESVNTPEFLDTITALKAESAVVVAFGQILSQKFLDLFPKSAVNLHGSLLPRWRGAAPIQRSIIAGDPETGIALQIIVKELDAGPILGIRKIPLPVDKNAVEAYHELAQLGCELLQVEYMDYLRGNLTPLIQDPKLVTVAPKIKKSEAAIRWSFKAVEIQNLVRGLAMGPVPHFKGASGQTVKLIQAKAISGSSHGSPGQVVAVSATEIKVQTGDGHLLLEILQPESRSRQKADEYLRGYPVAPGEIFLDGQVDK